MEDKEVWKEVYFDNNYEVSNFGRVRRKGHDVISKDGKNHYLPPKECNIHARKEYADVSIGGKSCHIAALVARTFMGAGEGYIKLYHKDGDFMNNRVDNIAFGGKKRVFLQKEESLSEKEILLLNYDISDGGVITRKVDGKVLQPGKDQKGYLRIRLKVPFATNPDGRKIYKVHRLVAMTYLPDYSETLQVNHKDGNKTNNSVSNLEMVTNSQNVLHAWRTLDKKGRLAKSLATRRRNHPKEATLELFEE